MGKSGASKNYEYIFFTYKASKGHWEHQAIKKSGTFSCFE